MGNQPSQTVDDISAFDPRRSRGDGDSRTRSYTTGDMHAPSMSAKTSALDRGVAAPAAAISRDTTTDDTSGAMGILSHVWAVLSPRNITKINGNTTAKTHDATTELATSTGSTPRAATTAAGSVTSAPTPASRRRVEELYEVSTQTLGRGHYAVVCRGRCRRTGRVVAIKKIKRFLTDEKRLRAEIAVLQRVKKHPNIVELIDVFETAREVHLVLELCTGGELFERLADKGPYSEADCARHLRDMATAVQYLHEQGIVHRDLKPENILLSTRNDADAVTKVADFGLAKIFTGTSLKTKCGTWGYSAPEMISGSGAAFGYDLKVDSWSLGIILYILLCGFHPFDPHGTHSDNEMIARIKSCQYDFEDEAWTTISMGARELIRHLLVLDPDERYSMEEVLRHPWLGGAGPATPLSPRIHQDLARFREQAKQKAQFDSFDDEVQNS